MTTTEIVDMITVVIDGFEVSVPKGTLVIRAAEQLGDWLIVHVELKYIRASVVAAHVTDRFSC